jgi:hypothetical protein
VAVSILGLAGLISTCLDIVQRVDAYKDYHVDSRAILAQWEADKYRFRQWARCFGAIEESTRDYEDSEIGRLLKQLLLSIREIFSRVDDDLFRQETTTTPKFQESSSRRRRVSWALVGKKRFVDRAKQFGELVQRLYDVVATGWSKFIPHIPVYEVTRDDHTNKFSPKANLSHTFKTQMASQVHDRFTMKS